MLQATLILPHTLAACFASNLILRIYWQHVLQATLKLPRTLAGTYPVPGKLFKLGCKENKGPDGLFQCYITMVCG